MNQIVTHPPRMSTSSRAPGINHSVPINAKKATTARTKNPTAIQVGTHPVCSIAIAPPSHSFHRQNLPAGKAVAYAESTLESTLIVRAGFALSSHRDSALPYVSIHIPKTATVVAINAATSTVKLTAGRTQA